VISTQVMQEFYVNVTRKIPPPLSLGQPQKLLHTSEFPLTHYGCVVRRLNSLEQTRRILVQYETWQVETIDAPLINFASKIQERNRLSFWDSLIIATVIQGNVNILYSEDLNVGQLIEGIEIVNPMLA
jgi:predicted nucleic acid-binding protein